MSSVTAFTRTVIIAAVALAFLMFFSMLSLPTAHAGENVPDQVHEVPTQFGSDDSIDWGPQLVIIGCIIVFAVGVVLAIYLRIMDWKRKWG